MPISSKIAHGLHEVDVIICGGGLTACVVAGRLARADPDLSILMIEGGQNNDGNPSVQHPALFPQNVVPASKTAVWYKAKKSEQLAGREAMVPTGGLLGGGSSINIMLYSRPVAEDFDSFTTPGWSTEEMLPFMRKLETYHGRGNPAVHGTEGLLHITRGALTGKVSEDDFLAAAATIGYPTIDSLHDLTRDLGFESQHKTVTSQGTRQDAATVYVHPLLKDGRHPNLHVLCESKVNRVLFDKNGQANGVEYAPNPDFQIISPATTRPKLTVKARKLVVVSAGALGSPLILQRSGVGNRQVLEKAHVPVIADLPGVGRDYQDHNLEFWAYKTDLAPNDTLDALWGGRVTPEEAAARGLLGWTSCDIHGKFRPSEEQVNALGPEFEKAWERDYRDKPGKPLMLMATSAAFVGDPSLVPAGQYFSPCTYTAYPYSRGHVYITGPDWEDPADFETGFFTDKDDIDLKMQILGYKAMREIMRRTSMYRGEVEIGHPKFKATSKAALLSLDEPLIAGGEVHDIEYTAEDDRAIEQYLRETIGTTWHSLGTCPMKPREQGGVVDADLNVYGTQGLKVVDLSIPPQNVGANLQVTGYTIGEKGADIILKELGLGEREANGLRN